MTWSFHPEAETEFHEAIDYYEECESGLGEDFAIEAHTTIQNILTYPEAWPTLDGDIRPVLPADSHMGWSIASKPTGYLSSR
jgi:toxin ParE1/3/4